MTRWRLPNLGCSAWAGNHSVARTLLVFIVLAHGAASGVFAQSASARWARGIGGIDDDYGWAVATDADRSIYVTGYVTGLAAAGKTNFVGFGGNDVVLAKYDHNGSFQWARRAGGVTNDQGRAVATGALGDVYVAGHFRGSGVFGGTNVASVGVEDLFLAKLNSSGQWLWTATAGGTNSDEGRSIAVDAQGNCYVAGIFFGTTAFGSNVLVSRGQTDVAVAKANGDGAWLWARSFGGAAFDESRGVAVNESGCYVTGYFNGTAEFPGTNLITRGGSDIFLAKLNAHGDLLWVRQAGGGDADEGHDLAVDPSGNVYMTGGFAGTANIFGTNVSAPGFAGSMDVFAVKLDSEGQLVWLQRATGTSHDSGNGIALDPEGNVYVSGLFVGSASFSSQRLTSTSGQADVFFVKYSPRGDFLWAIQSGGTAYMSGNSVAVDFEGSAYGTGFYRSSTSFGGLVLTNSSFGRDAFLVRVDGPPRLRITPSETGTLVSWPVWANGYQLQSSAGFGGTNVWADVTEAALTNGERREVSSVISNQRRFFRLRNP